MLQKRQKQFELRIISECYEFVIMLFKKRVISLHAIVSFYSKVFISSQFLSPHNFKRCYVIVGVKKCNYWLKLRKEEVRRTLPHLTSQIFRKTEKCPFLH